MKHSPLREGLVRAGMGCCCIAAAVTALNVLLLPFARACYGFGWLPELLACAAALALFIGLGGALRRMEDARAERIARIVRPAFLLLLLAVQLVLGCMMAYTPMGDNFMLIRGSQMLARDGSFAANPDFGLYLARFSNQWGFFLMLTGLFRLLSLFGLEDCLFVLAAIQALLYTAAMRAALSLARRLRGARGEIMMTAMLALCLPLYLAAAVLYTDTFSLPFVVFTLLCAQRVLDAQDGRGQLCWAALCALSVLIGGQIKMTVAIALIAAVILWLLRLPALRAVLLSALCAAVLALGTAGVHSVMLSGIIDPAVYAQQNTPLIHWVMMSIPTSDNPYGGATGDYGITWGMMDEGATHEEVMGSILTRMKDRIYTLRYPNRLLTALLRKNAAGMGDGTYGMTEMLDDGPLRENTVSAVVLEGRPYYALYAAVCTGIAMAHMLLAALGTSRALRARDTRTALPAVAMVGIILFLLLWEARGRYGFGFMPVLLLLSCDCACREWKAPRTPGGREALR